MHLLKPSYLFLHVCKRMHGNYLSCIPYFNICSQVKYILFAPCLPIVLSKAISTRTPFSPSTFYICTSIQCTHLHNYEHKLLYQNKDWLSDCSLMVPYTVDHYDEDQLILQRSVMCEQKHGKYRFYIICHTRNASSGHKSYSD